MRLSGFDYSRPLFYMVTLKALPGRQPLSAIVAPGRCEMNATTRAIVNCIRSFHEACPAIEPITCFSVMPDHVHLLVKIRECGEAGAKRLGEVGAKLAGAGAKRLEEETAGAAASPKSFAPMRLEAIIELLCQALEGRYRETTGIREPLFAAAWHDWIVKKEGQLAAFTRYIRQNPARAWLRHENRRFFTRPRQITFRGARYRAYGNEALLELPAIVAIKGHRRPLEAGARLIGEEGAERAGEAGPPKSFAPMRGPGLLAAAARIGPGGAGLSTFLSPLEKEAGNAIIAAGGALIVLSMQGFGERWHPTGKQERLCAAGRMLYLSRYAPQSTKLDKKEMHIRAHALVDWAIEHSHYHLEAWP